MGGRIASERRITDLALQDNIHAMAFAAMAFDGLRWYAEDSPNPGWGTDDERWAVYPDGYEFTEDEADESDALVSLVATSREIISILGSVSAQQWGPVHWGLARGLVLRHADLVSALVHGGILPQSDEINEMIRRHTSRWK